MIHNRSLALRSGGAVLQRYLIAVALPLASGCEGDCAPHGYEEGEQFRITVLASDVPDSTVLAPGVECSPLAIGDSFIVQAGPWRPPDGPGGCEKTTTTVTEVPPFARGYFTRCEDGGGQLSVECHPPDNNSCDARLFLATSPIITAADQLLETATLVVDWYNCHGSCLENFTVRIERLGKAQ